MPRKKLRYLCHASHHGRRIAGPHPDPNEVEREVSHVGGVRLIVRGSDGFPVEIVLLEKGLFEVED
jgi:hypothetical protein